MANIHIIDSYGYTKAEMRDALNARRLDALTPNYGLPEEKEVLANRSNFSLINEWCVHNLLYRLDIFKERCASVDLNYPQPWYIRVLYFCGGLVARIFIR